MILVNGIVSEFVPVMDRGLAYGDGVFRTLRLIGGRPLHWALHYAKLRRDCDVLGITCPDDAVLAGDIARLAEHETEGVIKIIITRGTGQRGYAPPATPSPTRIVIAAPMPQYSAHVARSGASVRFCSLRLGFQPALAGVKHLNRLENVLARAEWDDPEIVEGLMLDIEGNVIGGTMSNLFIVERNVLITPDLARCGVAGVTRERLLRAAAMTGGMPCSVEPISPERLLRSDAVLLTNSVMGVWQVGRLGDRTWPSSDMLARKARGWLDAHA